MVQFHRVEPVQGVNIGQALLGGLQTYQGVKRREAQEGRAQAQEGRAQTTADAETAQRFERERAFTASAIEGKPLDFQRQHLSERIALIDKRGGDSSTTQRLLAMYESGDPAQIEKANFAVSEARQQGETQGYLKPQEVARPKIDPYSGLVQGSPEHQAFARERLKKKGGTTVVVGAGEGAEVKELGKLRAKDLQNIREKGDLARSNLTSLDILNNTDVKQGALEPFKQSIAAWGDSLGIDTSKLANVPAGQSFSAESGKVVLNAMQAQKGPQTESDMKQIRSTVAVLGNTPEANTFINNAARATSMRAIHKQEFFDNFLDDKGTTKGANKAWNEYEGNSPLVSRFKNTKTGLPIFFHEFEQDAIQRSEEGSATQAGFTPTRKQILKQWRKMNRGRKTFKVDRKKQPEIPPLIRRRPMQPAQPPQLNQFPQSLAGLGDR
jgi:hypothetical protein